VEDGAQHRGLRRSLPALAARAQTRVTAGKAILGVGIALSIGSLIAIVGQAGANATCNEPSCMGGVGGYAAAGALWGVGLIGTIAGPFIGSRVTTAAEARRMGAEYNWRLRQSLGLPAN
jgi:hypothetical protein